MPSPSNSAMAEPRPKETASTWASFNWLTETRLSSNGAGGGTL